MTSGAYEMIEPLRPQTEPERFTSLQPTYEDSVPPSSEEEWELDERS